VRFSHRFVNAFAFRRKYDHAIVGDYISVLHRCHSKFITDSSICVNRANAKRIRYVNCRDLLYVREGTCVSGGLTSAPL